MTSFRLLTEEQCGILKSFLLNEASAISLHQFFDKTYGEDLVNAVLQIDTTTKKKFAEWVLKTSLNQSNGAEVIKEFIKNGMMEKLFKVTLDNSMQVYNYSNLEEAEDAYYEYAESNKEMKPSYEDKAVAIYVPTSYHNLRAILKKKFGKTADTFVWCVANSSAESHWPEYTSNDKYNIFLIYNKKEGELFLWNNNPRHYTTNFKDWHDNSVSPTARAGLTYEAMNWLDSMSDDVSIYDVGAGELLISFFEGMANVYDTDPDDMYYHYVHLYDENDHVVCEDWCYSDLDVTEENDSLAIVRSHSRKEDSLVYINEKGGISYIAHKESIYVVATNKDGSYFIEIEDDYDEDRETYLLRNGKFHYIPVSITYNGYGTMKFLGSNQQFIFGQAYDDSWFLYNLETEDMILSSISEIVNDSSNPNIATFVMDSYFDVYDIDYDEDNVDYSNADGDWIVKVDLNSGEIVYVQGPSEEKE